MSKFSRRGSMLALGTLGAMLCLSASPVAASVTTVKSAVTITSGEGTQFTGKVSSAKKRCQVGRTVKLYVEPPSTSRVAGDLAGTATTNSSGAWTIDGSFLAAYYYAVVTAVVIHVNGVPYRCVSDYSPRAHY